MPESESSAKSASTAQSSSKRSATTSGIHESSVLVNLRELMHLESERVHAEAELAVQAQEEARRAKEAGEARVRAEHEARIEAALAAQTHEADRIRDELARAEHEKAEAALRIRLEAERALRLAEQEQLLRHERELAALRSQTKTRLSPFALVGIGVAVVGAGVAAMFMLPRGQVSVVETAPALATVVAAPVAPVQVAASPPVLAETPPAPAATPRRSRHSRRPRSSQTSTATQGLESLVEDGETDVIDGLQETTIRHRRR